MIASVVASLPSPSGSGISIGPLDLRAYGLMIALGVIAAVWMMGRMLEQKRLGTAEDASSIAVWGVAAGVIGARLYHVATDWDRFSDDLGSIPRLWEGGLGIPGGLLAGVFAGLWQARRRGIGAAETLTCAAPAIPLAQAIGRWGNWFNQELFGKQTDLPWALEIDDDHLPAGFESGTTFHPTFLYESMWNIGLVGVLLWIDRRLRLGAGRLFAVYLIGYGAGRFWIEGLRIDPSSELGGLRWNQWVALAAVVGGGAYLVATRGRRWVDRNDGDDGAALDVDELDDAESVDVDDAPPGEGGRTASGQAIEAESGADGADLAAE
ncbi:MAG: prolipoprotein diacylglyceryl transferase [Ilumatobacter sp.]|uniref:prolipoprotein diacylglyceryl transferase n=1 Tax=Ilumatobacter sp. TaxID=1967498 RepID=UPI00261168E6|nr:prolipoprotein diacylglyceryl transferase [Ilumatobacter sp.]MDJ0771692.1 prolipoprotein diacylglyceryl transferase [Ilumatobacter sp.]